MAKNINIELTKGDTETLLWTFTDSNGDAYVVTSNTFYFIVGTTEGASDILSKSGAHFTLSSNTASLELSTTETNYTAGNYWYTCYFLDSNSKKTTIAHGRCIFTLERTGHSNTSTITVGTTTITVAMNVAYGTQDAFGSNYTASGDYIRGTGAATFEVQANNFAASTAPGVGDDSADGYLVGSRWVDTSGSKEYVCLDNTEGAAVWTETTAGAAGGETNTASSVGSGTSVFKQKSGVDLQFNAIKSENNLLGVALDAITNDIELTVSQSNINSGVSITASQVSDFDTEVSNNTTVSTNAEKLTCDSTNVNAAGAVMESDYDSNTILKADSDNVPSALIVAEQTLVGRITAGSITALNATQIRTLLNVEDGAQANTVTSVDSKTGAVSLSGDYAPISKGVTNGDLHDHNGGDGAQIDHVNLSNKGTNTHAQIDTAVSNSASHIGNTSNPHSVTAAQLSLDNVTNNAQVKKIASSTDNAIIRWDGITGDTPQDSLVTIDDTGSLNIPSGQAYKINGVALSYSDVGAAASANGVTNGDSHDHSGGDGAQISYSSLVSIPSTFAPSSHNNSAHSETYILSTGVTKEALATNGDVETTITDTDDKLPTSGAVIDYVAGITLNDQTGTTYELVLTDRGKLVTLTNASAITLTIPANASVAFPVGTQIEIVQLGAGQVTIAITSDTLYSSGGATKLTGQYSSAVLTKLTSTTWIMAGDITT